MYNIHNTTAHDLVAVHALWPVHYCRELWHTSSYLRQWSLQAENLTVSVWIFLKSHMAQCACYEVVHLDCYRMTTYIIITKMLLIFSRSSRKVHRSENSHHPTLDWTNSDLELWAEMRCEAAMFLSYAILVSAGITSGLVIPPVLIMMNSKGPPNDVDYIQSLLYMIRGSSVWFFVGNITCHSHTYVRCFSWLPMLSCLSYATSRWVGVRFGDCHEKSGHAAILWCWLWNYVGIIISSELVIARIDCTCRIVLYILVDFSYMPIDMASDHFYLWEELDILLTRVCVPYLCIWVLPCACTSDLSSFHLLHK